MWSLIGNGESINQPFGCEAMPQWKFVENWKLLMVEDISTKIYSVNEVYIGGLRKRQGKEICTLEMHYKIL